MSEETTKAPGVEIDYFIRDHLPQASWIVGGAFRFDVHLLVLVNYLASFFKPRRIARVAGAPPCPWSLDMLEPRAPMSPRACASIISSYAEARVGLLLVFDNPSISPENREDAFGIWLVQELTKKANNPTGRNGVVVADDSLAELLRRKFPKLTIICHPNRLIMSNDKRTAEIYGTLCEKYTQVVLHPRDAVLPSIYTRLKYPERVIAIVNDPVPRRYPSRRDLINLAIQLRKNPYNYELVESMHRLHERTGLFTDEDTCNLTKNEEASLYGGGVRSFAIQAQFFRNELTLWWDMFHHMLRTAPEHTNKAALIATAALACIREDVDKIPSGLSLFSQVGELDMQ